VCVHACLLIYYSVLKYCFISINAINDASAEVSN